MSLPQEKLYYTPEQYLELERQAVKQHEYLDGHIYVMAGESLNHSQICINLSGLTWFQLRGTNCQALSPNMKVRAQTKSLFAYPDLSIVCGEPVFHDEKQDVLLNPRVIFEVLSPSTARYDRTMKFFRYRAEIASLTDYILVSQDSPFIEHYEKQANGRWLHEVYADAGDTLLLASIGCELRLSDIYERVQFEPTEDEGERI